MIKAAVQGLMGRKLRTLLTSLSIVLGVAMVSGTYVLTDTISKAFDGIFEGSYKNTSVVISGKEVVKNAASGNATVPAALATEVREQPGVQAASGAVFDVSGTTDLADMVGRDGEQIGSEQAPHFGWGFDPKTPQFNPMALERGGRWASGPNQVVIDAGTAKNENYSVGDRIEVSGEGPARRYLITGVAKFGDVDSIGGATFAVFDVPTAQEVLGKTGEVDQIFVAAKEGVSDDELKSQVEPLVPPSAEVKTGAEQGQADAQETNDGIAFIQYFLLAFAGIALIVGSFVIFNTLSMTVAQRVRELATLRTLGATQKQVRRSVLVEGVITGLFASIVGLILGLGLAKGLNALFVALGVDLPTEGTVFKARTVIVSLLIGVGITVLASISPARRAMRVPPISAVREGATLPQSRLEQHGKRASAVVLLVAAVLLAVGLFGGLSTGLTLLTIGIGCLLLFVGVALIASRVVLPLAAVIGAPGERFGGAPGRLARENATRNPVRTARTAGALMIGLALVAFVATLGSGLRNTDRDALDEQVTANYVVTSENGYDPVTSSAGDAVAKAPGVTVASHVRSDAGSAFGSDVDATGVDPSTIGQVYDFRWKDDGSNKVLLTLGFEGVIVRSKFAEAHDLKPGSRFDMTTPQGKKVPLLVKGVYEPPAEELDMLLGDVTLAQRAFDTHFPRPKDLFTFVNTRAGESGPQTAALEGALRPFPDAVVRTKAGWVEERASGLDQILNIFYVMLALSVVVSLFGMVNALALSVFERTRELGMLRAVGLTRRQTRRMVRYEGVITAMIGAALGLPLGILLGAVVTRGLHDLDVSFSVPIVTILVFAIVAMIAGTLAAILPARRASRLNVLNALQYE